MVSGRVRPGVPGAQQTGQRFATGDLRAVQERQQRVKPERPFPRLRRVFLVLRMRNRDRGIEVDVQQPAHVGAGTGGPRPLPCRRSRGQHSGQVDVVDPVEHPPGGRHAGHRPAHLMPVTEYLDMRDTIRAIRDGHRQVGEHLTRRMLPGTGIGVGQGGGHTLDQAGVLGQFPQHPHPGMRHHTTPIGTDLDPPRPLATLHPRSAFP